MKANDIKVGDKFRYRNMKFVVLKKLKNGVEFKYQGKIYFREYEDIDLV